ncbi:hypothetical protein GALMADRAFT_217289 [Galerina marginata CBS 339.88]|uniref:Uncharacterized protein n=1 Tax=Galerina marginata (strain CBS 339.88) TaxID=685588 RepID=A0A067SDS5_GALM3|nr:hypothetical protein GALMADRAFT_217289 [Galerina marginata CBS 339.88]
MGWVGGLNRRRGGHSVLQSVTWNERQWVGLESGCHRGMNRRRGSRSTRVSSTWRKRGAGSGLETGRRCGAWVSLTWHEVGGGLETGQGWWHERASRESQRPRFVDVERGRVVGSKRADWWDEGVLRVSWHKRWWVGLEAGQVGETNGRCGHPQRPGFGGVARRAGWARNGASSRHKQAPRESQRSGVVDVAREVVDGGSKRASSTWRERWRMAGVVDVAREVVDGGWRVSSTWREKWWMAGVVDVARGVVDGARNGRRRGWSGRCGMGQEVAKKGGGTYRQPQGGSGGQNPLKARALGAVALTGGVSGVPMRKGGGFDAVLAKRGPWTGCWGRFPVGQGGPPGFRWRGAKGGWARNGASSRHEQAPRESQRSGVVDVAREVVDGGSKRASSTWREWWRMAGVADVAREVVDGGWWALLTWREKWWMAGVVDVAREVVDGARNGRRPLTGGVSGVPMRKGGGFDAVLAKRGPCTGCWGRFPVGQGGRTHYAVEALWNRTSFVTETGSLYDVGVVRGEPAVVGGKRKGGKKLKLRGGLAGRDSQKRHVTICTTPQSSPGGLNKMHNPNNGACVHH